MSDWLFICLLMKGNKILFIEYFAIVVFNFVMHLQTGCVPIKFAQSIIKEQFENC